MENIIDIQDYQEPDYLALAVEKEEGGLMERGCVQFRCLRRHGYYCCADCRERDVCRRDCHNDPEICGLVRDRAPRKKEVKKFACERERRENRDGPGA